MPRPTLTLPRDLHAETVLVPLVPTLALPGGQRAPNKMGIVTIAVEGCAHGELDGIYDAIRAAEKQNGQKIDLLVCCGDFQAVRNKAGVIYQYMLMLVPAACLIHTLCL